MASSTSATGGMLGANGTTNFIPGLASGMDTEDMVEKLLSGTQAKIDKQNAKKQQIEWKQEIYRDVITKINGFQDKYFSFLGTNNTNLLSSGFYNVMSASSSSGAVKVTSAKSSAPSNMVINSISQLAEPSRGESARKVTGELKGNITAGSFEEGTTYSFDMSLDGVRKTIKFVCPQNPSDLVSSINESVKKVFGNTVQFKSDMTLAFNTSGAAPSPSTDTSHRVILYNSVAHSGNETDASKQVVTDGVLQNMGFKSGASNKLDYGSYLSDVPFARELQGKNFTFTINGTEIKASSKDTLGDVINRINNSEAGVKVSYSSIKDTFLIESTNTGADIDIKMEQTEGNLLSSMFGMKGGHGVGGSLSGLRNSKTIQTDPPIEKGLFDALLSTTDTQSTPFSLNVNGKDYTVEIPNKDGGYQTSDDFIAALNNELKKKFGTNVVGQNNVNVNISKANNKYVFEIESTIGYKVALNEKNLNNSLAGKMGFKKDSVQGDTDETEMLLGDLFAGKTFPTNLEIVVGPNTTHTVELKANDSLSDLMTKIESKLNSAFGNGTDVADVTFDKKTGNLTILSGTEDSFSITASGDGKDVLNILFGRDQLDVNKGGVEKFRFVEGKNAILEVNGTTMERNTNTFELDGITMELTATTATGDAPINLTTSKDTDKIVEGLKGFVDDYNALIKELNDQVNAEASYRKYEPLTEAQKKEMSEREIENWEKKAKEGLLRNDSNISRFLMEMRTAMYQTVESAGLALYEIGIESSNSYRDNGKLVLDESKLKSALTTRLDDIQTLFTDKDNGIAVQLQSVLKATANPSSGSPGSLVRYAGTKDVMVTSNTLYNELKGIKETLSKLNTKYTTERTRYWKQFTQMEQAISKMNSQSSWLTQQFS